MKKLLLLAFVLPAFSGFAQFTGGGTSNPPAGESKREDGERSAFRKTYLRLGLNSPSGQLGGTPDMSIPLYENIAKSGGMGVKPGALFEVGHYYYFNNKSESKFRYGLDWTIIALTYNPMSWENTDGNWEVYDDAFAFVTASSRLGPVVSYNFAGKGVVSLYARIAAQGAYTDFSYTRYNAGEEFEETLEATTPVLFAVKANFGITIGYGAGSISLDLDPGKFKMPYSYYSSESDSWVDHDEDMPASFLQLKLGLRL